MSSRKYAPEIHRFILEHVKGTTTRDLAKLVNNKFGTDFTEPKMKSYKANHKLKSETPCGLSAGSPTKQYPEEIRNFIKMNHPGIGPKDMANLLNRTFKTNYTKSQMKGYYGNHSTDSGLNGEFKKGHIPINKGRKGVDGWEPTQFKKGHKPANWVSIGSERVNGDDYVDVKVADGKKQKNWKGKHILIWEKENGPVPKDHAVIFGDGNNRNFDINNLLLVSRGQLATLNHKGLIQKSADLTRTAIIMTDLYHKISERRTTRRVIQ